MTLELSMYFLAGVLFVVCCLIGVIWNQKNEELKEHSRLISLKANNDKLTELDHKMEKELRDMEANNERLIEKLEHRQQKDIEAVSAGFRDQISGIREAMTSMERNILRQIEYMFNAQNKQ